MSQISNLLAELDERTVARSVGNKFDNASISFSLTSNQVATEEEYYDVLSKFYNHVHNQCIVPGISLSHDDALSRALEIVDGDARRKGGSPRSSYVNAVEGLNGGLRKLLDVIVDGLKSEAIHRYTEGVMRRYISPMQWDQQVAAVRELVSHFSGHWSSDIDTANPERYASDYSRLIQSLSQHLNQVAQTMRRY